MIIPRCRGLRLAFTLVTSLYVCMNNNDYPSMQRIATLTCFFCLCLECSIITMIIPRCRGLRLDLSPYINYELVMNITMIIPRCRGLRLRGTAWSFRISSHITMIIPRCRGLRQCVEHTHDRSMRGCITMIIPRCRGLRPYQARQPQRQNRS